MSIAVESRNVHASAFSTSHRTIVGAVDEREHALSEVLGVDEEGWRVEAVHEQPGTVSAPSERAMSW